MNKRKSITYWNEQEKKTLHIGLTPKYYVLYFFFKFVFTVLFPYRIMLLMQFFRVLLFASWFNDTIIYELVI